MDLGKSSDCYLPIPFFRLDPNDQLSDVHRNSGYDSIDPSQHALAVNGSMALVKNWHDSFRLCLRVGLRLIISHTFSYSRKRKKRTGTIHSLLNLNIAGFHFTRHVSRPRDQINRKLILPILCVSKSDPSNRLFVNAIYLNAHTRHKLEKKKPWRRKTKNNRINPCSRHICRKQPTRRTRNARSNNTSRVNATNLLKEPLHGLYTRFRCYALIDLTQQYSFSPNSRINSCKVCNGSCEHKL